MTTTKRQKSAAAGRDGSRSGRPDRRFQGGELREVKASPSNGAARAVRRGEGLLPRFLRTRSVKVRNQLVERYRGLVESMARTMATRLPPAVDVHDLIHAGVWGLMQAIESFDPRRGSQFVPFMRVRVRGAMLDELRNLDFLPRIYRRRSRDLAAAQQELRERLGREASDAELADALGISENRLRRQYYLLAAPPAGNGAASGGNGAPLVERDDLEALADGGAQGPLEAVDRRELIEAIAASLQPIEWKVLRLHYLEGMSGRAVARKLRLSASRICQIHGRVLSRLKSRLRGL
jgi:RNA polymerase sigma factor for flagellar operon FliA